MNQQIIIYHTNDMHARVSTLDDNNLSIGLDKISKIVNTTLIDNKNTLWFDAGDLMHGTPRININHGENMIDLLNPTHLAALCPGNHEFNFSSNQLHFLSSKLKPSILCANAVYKNTYIPFLLPYMIYNIDLNKDDYISRNSNDSNKDNLKIGVFGLTTPEAAYKTNPENVKDLDFINPIEVAQNMVKTLKSSCDIIIALTHLGLDESSEFTSKKLAEETDGLDLIIDGHSHTVLEHGLKIKDTLIVQAGSHGKYLGKVILTVKNKKIVSKEAILLGENQIDRLIKKPDTFISQELNNIEEEMNQFLSKTIAVSDKTLNGDRLTVRRQESELGNFAANACWKTIKSDFSIVNAGDIRTSLLKGPITYKDILAIFPFQNKIHLYEITGNKIKAMLEHSIEFMPASFGGFLNVSSNVKFICNPQDEPGKRIKEIYINDRLIDLDKTYTISMSSFLAAGGDDYKILKELTKLKEFDTIENLIIKYITAHGIQEEDYKLGRIICEKN